jgi:hypothetical protein
MYRRFDREFFSLLVKIQNVHPFTPKLRHFDQHFGDGEKKMRTAQALLCLEVR